MTREEFLIKLSEKYHQLGFMTIEKEEVKMQADSLVFWYDLFCRGKSPEWIFSELEAIAVKMGIYHKGATELFGKRSVTHGSGPKLHLGLSRFYWLREWKYNRDRVLREMDSDVSAGFTYARCLAQVENMPGSNAWTGKEILPTWPDHQSLMEGLTSAAENRGLRILWTFLGKGGNTNLSSARKNIVVQCANALKGVKGGVLVNEIMNEAHVGGEVEWKELRDLASLAEEICGIPTATSSSPSEDPVDWEESQNPNLKIAHLDRTRTGAEYDRPWRKAWEYGLAGNRWIDNEPIGPGSSVESEDRPSVLRSMRLVAYICRAFATCFHSRAGVYGDIDMNTTPGYREVAKCMRYITPGMIEGIQISVRDSQSWWRVPDDEFVANSGKGMLRLYSLFDSSLGWMFSVAFGLVSDVTVYARKAMWVDIINQDDDEVRRVELQPDQPLILKKRSDYLLKAGVL